MSSAVCTEGAMPACVCACLIPGGTLLTATSSISLVANSSGPSSDADKGTSLIRPWGLGAPPMDPVAMHPLEKVSGPFSLPPGRHCTVVR